MVHLDPFGNPIAEGPTYVTIYTDTGPRQVQPSELSKYTQTPTGFYRELTPAEQAEPTVHTTSAAFKNIENPKEGTVQWINAGRYLQYQGGQWKAYERTSGPRGNESKPIEFPAGGVKIIADIPTYSTPVTLNVTKEAAKVLQNPKEGTVQWLPSGKQYMQYEKGQWVTHEKTGEISEAPPKEIKFVYTEPAKGEPAKGEPVSPDVQHVLDEIERGQTEAMKQFAPKIATSTATSSQQAAIKEQREKIELQSKMLQSTRGSKTMPMVMAGGQVYTEPAYLETLVNEKSGSMTSVSMLPVVGQVYTLLAPSSEQEAKERSYIKVGGKQLTTNVFGKEQPIIGRPVERPASLEEKVVAGASLATLGAVGGAAVTGSAALQALGGVGTTALGGYSIVKSVPEALQGKPEGVFGVAMGALGVAAGGYMLYRAIKPPVPAAKVTYTVDKNEILFEKEKVEVGDTGAANLGGKVRAVNPRTGKIETVGEWKAYGGVTKVGEDAATGKQIFSAGLQRKIELYPEYKNIFKVPTQPQELGGLTGTRPAEVSFSEGSVVVNVPEGSLEVSSISEINTKLKTFVAQDLSHVTSQMGATYTAEISPPKGTVGAGWKTGEVKSTGAPLVKEMFGKEVSISGAKYYGGISVPAVGGGASVAESQVMTLGPGIYQKPFIMTGWSSGADFTTGASLVKASTLSGISLAEAAKPTATLTVNPTVSPTAAVTSVIAPSAAKITAPTSQQSVQQLTETMNAPEIVSQSVGFSSNVLTIYPKEESRVVKIKPAVSEPQLQALLQQEMQKRELALPTAQTTVQPSAAKEKETTLQQQMDKIGIRQGENIRQVLGISPRQISEQSQRQLYASAQIELQRIREKQRVVTPTIPGFRIWPPQVPVTMPIVRLPTLMGEAYKGKRKGYWGYFERKWPVVTTPKEMRKVFKRL